ncbi:MAG: hypothetical protein RB294_07055 [Bacteroidales bacterium]|jgi:hypothetical protein|nr:hypothetical protein [Bacteroidales bacterium]
MQKIIFAFMMQIYKNTTKITHCRFHEDLHRPDQLSPFPNAWMLNEEVTPQDTPQVEQLLLFITAEHSRAEIHASFGLADKRNFVDKYLSPALHAGLIEMTIPGKPKHRDQKYRLTESGILLKAQLEQKKRWFPAKKHTKWDTTFRSHTTQTRQRPKFNILHA